MARIPPVQDLASTTHTTTRLIQEQRVTLRLKPRQKKSVRWNEDTVDNEHMNKKKSKKCCIFHKQRAFDESSSDEDDECEHRSKSEGKSGEPLEVSKKE